MIAITGISLFLVYGLFRYLAWILLPFFIGLLCAVWLQKPLSMLVKHTPLSKGVWSLLIIGGLTVLVFGALIYSSTVLYDRLFWFIEQATKLLPVLKERMAILWERFASCTQKLPPTFVEQLQSAPEQLADRAVLLATDWLTRLATGAMKILPSLLIGIVVTVAACFFTTTEYNRITSFLMHHSSPRFKKMLIETKHIFTHRVFAFMRGYLCIMGITFIELFFGFLILRIPYASTLALLVAMVDILPVLGTGTVLIPWSSIALFLGSTTMGTGVFILYVVITMVRNLIEPKILGKQMGLPPLITLAAMYVGLKLFGFIGLWGIPLLLIIVLHLYKKGLFTSAKNLHS